MWHIKKEKTLYREAHEWPKCTKQTFHNRVARGLSFEEAIKPEKIDKNISARKYREQYTGEDKVSRSMYFDSLNLWYPKEIAVRTKLTIKERYPKEYKFWSNYKSDKKCSFSTFVWRVKVHNDYEKAIKPLKEQHISWPTHQQAKRVIPKSYYEIDITLKPEEAKIFHSIYRGIIDKIEEEIYTTEDTSTVKKLDEKLAKIKQEYQTFLTFNPLHHV